MSIFNAGVDRAMRGLVTWRMRPRIAYSATDTAVLIVTSGPGVHPDDIPNGARLMRWARAAGISAIVTSRDRPADCDAPDPPRGLPETVVILEPFPGLSAFTNPSVSATLADKHLDRVIIAGSRTDIEIDSTARDAIESGLHTTVVGDCCTGSSSAGHRATVDVTLPRLVHAVMNIDDLPAPTR
ncbi:MAG: isochorismatase family protein [Rhodococcus sp. (in: high G+C Gram-positive bacteria)]